MKKINTKKCFFIMVILLMSFIFRSSEKTHADMSITEMSVETEIDDSTTSESKEERKLGSMQISMTDILVGIVVPIVAAWISYYLAERAMRKKENSRLYIQIELIKRELQLNDKVIGDYIHSIEEKNEIEKALEFPLVFMKKFLINVLDSLHEIKEEYMHAGNFIFEHPTQAYILSEKIRELDEKILELECQGYADEYLDEKRKEKLSKEYDQREQCCEEFKKLKDRDIYKEFSGLQMRIEKLMVGDIFEKTDKTENDFITAKFIYERIKRFNEDKNRTKEKVLELYNDLVIFNIESDIVEDGVFDQEKYDLYYKTFGEAAKEQKELVNLLEKYYQWRALKDYICDYSFDFVCKRWEENASDLVLINNRELYIRLVELYEKIYDFANMEAEEEEKYKKCIDYHNEIGYIIDGLKKHERKLNKKINKIFQKL